MRQRLARRALWLGSLALAIVACTEQLVVRPEGDFSWEPEAQLVWPVEGAIVGAYGESGRKNHQGIDLAARPGAPVAAALLGDVVFAGEVRGYGKVVALAHGDRLTTVYAHLGETRVAPGERVIRGQTIGTVGGEGYLHYEIRDPRRPVDPAQYYSTAPRPVVGGSADVHENLNREPPAVGVLGLAEEAAPTRIPTLEPIPPTPVPTPTLAPRAKPTPAPRVEEIPPMEPATSEPSGAWSGVRLGAALVGANLFYVPAKLVYAAIGGVTGAAALVLSQDTAVANQVWTSSLGGDYIVTAAHLRGEESIHFAGSAPETRAPPAPQTP